MACGDTLSSATGSLVGVTGKAMAVVGSSSCFVVYSQHHFFLTLLLLLVVVPSVLEILHLLLQQQHVRWIVKNIPSTEAAADNPCSATLLPFPYTNSQRVKKKKGGGEGENYSVCCITDHDHSK
jgi:hypothetical protein